MPYQDSCPVRRNLTATSLLFIAYYWGGAKLVEDKLVFPFVKLEFEHIGFIAFMAWGMLFWFAYRFWQQYGKKFLISMSGEFRSQTGNKLIQNYIASKTGLRLSGENKINHESPLGAVERTFTVHSISIQDKHIHAAIDVYKIQRISGQSLSSVPDESEVIIFNDIFGWWVVIRVFLYVCFKYKSFAEFLVPYLLFAVVILSAFAIEILSPILTVISIFVQHYLFHTSIFQVSIGNL